MNQFFYRKLPENMHEYSIVKTFSPDIGIINGKHHENIEIDAIRHILPVVGGFIDIGHVFLCNSGRNDWL
jgi:hypothetical protein